MSSSGLEAVGKVWEKRTLLKRPRPRECGLYRYVHRSYESCKLARRESRNSVGEAKYPLDTAIPAHQRRGRDSNPRWTKPPIPVFETGISLSKSYQFARISIFWMGVWENWWEKRGLRAGRRRVTCACPWAVSEARRYASPDRAARPDRAGSRHGRKTHSTTLFRAGRAGMRRVQRDRPCRAARRRASNGGQLRRPGPGFVSPTRARRSAVLRSPTSSESFTHAQRSRGRLRCNGTPRSARWRYHCTARALDVLAEVNGVNDVSPLPAVVTREEHIVPWDRHQQAYGAATAPGPVVRSMSSATSLRRAGPPPPDLVPAALPACDRRALRSASAATWGCTPGL